MKIIYTTLLAFLIFLSSGCQTIENKTQEAIDKENQKLGKLIQKTESALKIEMGEADKINYNDKGSKFFIYTKKKYGITCERIFEINKSQIVIGFTSKGCF